MSFMGAIMGALSTAGKAAAGAASTVGSALASGTQAAGGALASGAGAVGDLAVKGAGLIGEGAQALGGMAADAVGSTAGQIAGEGIGSTVAGGLKDAGNWVVGKGAEGMKAITEAPSVIADMDFPKTLAGSNEKKLMSGLTKTAEATTGMDITGALTQPVQSSISLVEQPSWMNTFQQPVNTNMSLNGVYDAASNSIVPDARTFGQLSTTEQLTNRGIKSWNQVKDIPSNKIPEQFSLGKPKQSQSKMGASPRMGTSYSPHKFQYNQEGLRALQQSQNQKNRQLLGL